MTQRVLVTGAGGFIGANLVAHLLQVTDWEVVGVDSFRHRGITDRLARPPARGVIDKGMSRRFRLVVHNLAVPVSAQMAARIGRVDVVFALASGSHVDTSIQSPREFAENNVAVGLTTLEYVREWQPSAHLILVSTDEVYGTVDPGYLHPEWDAVVPSNPYSASKAAQEALAVAWWRTYGLAVTIVNMHNVYGPMQHPEKFVPKVISTVLRSGLVEIHGAGPEHGSRHWLHVSDVASALLYIANELPAERFGLADVGRPNRWNIASSNRHTNLQTAQYIADVLGRELQWAWSSARPGRDKHYGLTGRKLAAMGWHPVTDFDTGIRETVQWYKSHPEWLLP